MLTDHKLSPCKRKLDVKFIPRSEEYGETRCVVFKQKEGESRNSFRQRRGFLRASTGSRKQRTRIQILSSENYVKSFFEEQRDYVLAEAQSEILKAESKVDTLDTCIREFQRQAHSHRSQIVGMKNLEESRPDFTKNWFNEKKHLSGISRRWMNGREPRDSELTNSLYVNREKVMLRYRSSHQR